VRIAENSKAGSFAVAGLEAGEAVLDDVNAADAVLASQSISREEDTSAICGFFWDFEVSLIGMPFSKSMTISSGSLGAERIESK